MGLLQSKEQVVKNVVSNVDIKKYAGLWYEIAKIPTSYEPEESYNVTATYTLNNEGGVDVYNQSFVGTEMKTIKGKAKPVNEHNSQLDVTFEIYGFDIHGDYWIVRLDKNYQWSIVSEPYGENLWILSRNKYMSDEIYESLLEMIRTEIDISKLKRTWHSGI